MLQNEQPTLHALHTVARLLGAIRLMVFPRQPNYLELGLKVKPEGLSTDMLPAGGEVTLNFRQLALVYQPATGTQTLIPLNGWTQAALLETLLAAIYAGELADVMPHPANTTFTDAMFAAADGFVNRIKPKRDNVSSNAPLHLDTQNASAYADALYSIFTSVARFHARLNGSVTPVVVWPEHFDLSFLWFAAEPDEQHPHLNFGFAPFSDGINMPYFYAYSYPAPSQAPRLPEGARWNTQGWTGVVLPYAEIARQPNPEAYVEASCTAIYRALRQALG